MECSHTDHQVLRIDREPNGPAPEADRARVHAAADELSDDFDALLVSDYGYGLVARSTAELARGFRDADRVCVLDPRSDVERFEGALSALTPNVGELARFVRVDARALDDVREFRAAAMELHRRLAPRWLLVTRGNLGMALFGEGCPPEGIAVEASGDGEVTDVTGAGDTAAAVFTLALAARAYPAQAMVLANAAAGVVVMENGAAVCTPSGLASALPTAPAAVRLAQTESAG